MVDLTHSLDGQPVMGARLSDLDMALVQRHIKAARERDRLRGPTDPESFLRHARAAVMVKGELVPTLAGILMFADDPGEWIPAAGVDVAQFKGSASRSTDISFLEQVRGPLPAVVEQTVQILWDRTDHGYRLEPAQRVDEHAFPRVVLRELTVNALFHRDWGLTGSRVRVSVHPEAITWTSPGELPPGIRIEDLLVIQHARNPILVQLAFEAGLIEGLGLGLDTVFDALRANGSPPPELRSAARMFTVRVVGREITVRMRVTDTQEDRQAALVELLREQGPLSIGDLAALLGRNRRTLQRDLRALLDSGQVEATGETNNRRYRLRR
jgi:ATP-dependent DNA helicase RecG